MIAESRRKIAAVILLAENAGRVEQYFCVADEHEEWVSEAYMVPLVGCGAVIGD